MNEKQFEPALKAAALELDSMSREELRRAVEKRENCDFARIFVETGEAADEDFECYPTPINQPQIILPLSEEKLAELVNQAVAKQLQLFLPIMVEKILSQLEPAASV